MKLVATVKLLVDAVQKERLLATMRRVNEACDWLAGEAFAARSANKYTLQAAHYHTLRERFGLSAQHAVRAISKVCEVYKRDKSKRPTFKPLGAVPHDQLYLYVTVEVPDGSPVPTTAFLGVDLGIRNLATDSDGEHHSGAGVEAVRQRYARVRAGLQHAQTRSARRHLHRLAGREARFRSIENHRISKQLVAKAKDTGRGIALEELCHIRERGTVRGPKQRAKLHGWSFFQLRSHLVYKAVLAGVPLIFVEPRNTSRTCLECGVIDKASRRSQSAFRCTACGFEAHADVVGAGNIQRRAEINQPRVRAIREGTPRLPLPAQGQDLVL